MGITMRQKRWNLKRVCKEMLAAALFLGCFWVSGIVSLADSTGKVTVESANVRKEADKNSEIVGSAAKNAEVTILDEVSDSAGTAWYKIQVDGNTTGYVRADLINRTDEGETASGSQTAAAGAAAEAETPMDPQYASVSVQAAKIRTAPSTNNTSVVESLEEGTQLVVSGQSAGEDGKTWYYVSFSGNGGEKTGYVRSDLVTLGELLPAEEPEQEEQPAEPEQEEQPAEPEHNDYEVVYTTDNEGNYCYYLYDNVEGSRQKLDEVLAAAHGQNENAKINAETVVRQRIVIIVMAVLLALLVITAAVLIIRLRNSYYYEEYEEDEEEDEDEDENEDEREAVRRSSRLRSRAAEPDEESYERAGVRREEEELRPEKRAERPQAVPEQRTEREARRPRRMPEEAASEESIRKSAPAPRKKAKNFLLDDDEFEFEFLNMDDKDL